LVANAWDADATEASISLTEHLTSSPIVVADNGYGMNMSETERAYLAVAYDRRRHGGSITPKDTGGKYSLTKFSMAPRPAPGPPLHIHEDADETVYVLEGELEMGLGDQKLVGSAGSIMLVPRGRCTPWPTLGRGLPAC